MDEASLARIPDSSYVNCRAGATRGNILIKGYGTNFLNDISYTDIHRNRDLVRPATNDVILGLPPRLISGLR